MMHNPAYEEPTEALKESTGTTPLPLHAGASRHSKRLDHDKIDSPLWPRGTRARCSGPANLTRGEIDPSSHWQRHQLVHEHCFTGHGQAKAMSHQRLQQCLGEKQAMSHEWGAHASKHAGQKHAMR
jgi:hypothetical protein